jgi:hypothetical protein
MSCGRYGVVCAALVVGCGDSGMMMMIDPNTPLTMMIGAAGGTIISADKKLSLEIPAGALLAETNIGIERLPSEKWSAAIKAYDPSDVYRLTPDGTTFALPVVARLGMPTDPYQGNGVYEAIVPLFGSESNAQIEELEETGFESDPDEMAWSWTTELTHFSNFFVFQQDERDGMKVRWERPRLIRSGESDFLTVRMTPTEPDRMGFTDGARMFAWVEVNHDGRTIIQLFPDIARDDAATEDLEGTELGRVGSAFLPEQILFNVRTTCDGWDGYDATYGNHDKLGFIFGHTSGVPALSRLDGGSSYGVKRIVPRINASVICRAAMPVGGGDIYSTPSDTKLAVAAPGLLANDSQRDRIKLSVPGVKTQPTHGTLMTRTDGSFEYTPSAGYTGDDAFDYILSDGVDHSEVLDNSIEILPRGPQTVDVHVTIHVGAVAPPSPADTVWQLAGCSGSLAGTYLWAFWSGGAMVDWEQAPSPPPDGMDNGCRPGYPAGTYFTAPFGSWSMDAMGRLVIDFCGGRYTKRIATYAYDQTRWKNIDPVSDECLVVPTATYDYSKARWACVGSTTGCINVSKTCNGGAPSYTGPLYSQLCKCYTPDGCSECIPNYSGSLSGHWNYEHAVTPVCP